ncbi:hypothetical protein C8Q77DRAFT_220703 [Trametes polyzona]|nr:hypothetical protein C8Q77DRAFT_220703 [Trametes polyzona]
MHFLLDSGRPTCTVRLLRQVGRCSWQFVCPRPILICSAGVMGHITVSSATSRAIPGTRNWFPMPQGEWPQSNRATVSVSLSAWFNVYLLYSLSIVQNPINARLAKDRENQSSTTPIPLPSTQPTMQFTLTFSIVAAFVASVVAVPVWILSSSASTPIRMLTDCSSPDRRARLLPRQPRGDDPLACHHRRRAHVHRRAHQSARRALRPDHYRHVLQRPHPERVRWAMQRLQRRCYVPQRARHELPLRDEQRRVL